MAGGVAGAMKGGYGGAALGVAAGLGAAKSDITFLIRHPMYMTRLNEDQHNLILQNSQSLYQRKQNYEHDFRYQTLKLNKVAGTYQKPAVSNRDAQELCNKYRGVVGDVYLTVRIPSPAQSSMINHIYSNFGCECVSDYFTTTPLNIHSSMKGGIYKFSQIEGGAIQSSITDPTLRDILRQILQNGVKFQPHRFNVENVPDTIEHNPDLDVQIETDPTKIKTWTKEIWIKYKNTTKAADVIKAIKALPNYGLRDEEWEQYKDKIRTGKDTDLLEDVDRIISNRDSGEVVTLGKITPDIKDLQLEIEELTARVDHITKENERLQTEKQDLDTKRTEAETKLSKAEDDLQKTRKQLTDLQTEKADVERQLADCQQNIETYSQDIESLNEQLRTCKVDLDNAIKSQGTIGTINTAEIKTLKAKVKELETTVASKQTELDEATNRATALQARVGELETTISNNTEALNKLKKECDDAKKKLADEVQSHKEDKEDLTQQLNNERRLTLNKTDEVNRLTKEKENLENQKFDIERQLRETIEAKDKVQKQLDRCRKDRPRPGRPSTTPAECPPVVPSTVPNECNLMSAILNDPYEVDLKEFGNEGYTRFYVLLVNIVHNIK